MGGSYQKTFRNIKKDKWYIIDTFRRDLKGKPKMLKKEFDNKKQAEMNIEQYFPGNLRFDIIKGDKAMGLKLYIMNAYPNLRIYLRKYRYAIEMVTEQNKKSYRTKFRRQNRNKKGQFYKRWG